MDKNLSVLIIEDDSNMRILFEFVFEGFKISCSSVNSLGAAKRELESYIPTFIVLDNSLKDESGIPFKEYIHTNFPCIKIILCISDYWELLKPNEKSGIYRHIEKPFMIEKLNIIIRDLINIPRCIKEEKCFNQECSRIIHNYAV